MLEKKTNELVNEIKELVDLACKQISIHDLKDMDAVTLNAVQSCIKLGESACELMVEEAKMMDDMDRKLDEVLEILRKEEES